MDNINIEIIGDRIIMTKDDKQAGYIHIKSDGKTIDLIKIYVDPAFRGQSLAGTITRWAFEWAQNNEQKIIPTCPYINKSFLLKNPEYCKLIKK